MSVNKDGSDLSNGLSSVTSPSTGVGSTLSYPNDPREIVLSVSGSSDTFHSFLSRKKNIKNMDVSSSVKLYSDEGFKINQNVETENPYAVFDKVFNAAQTLRKSAFVFRIIKGTSKALNVAQKTSSATDEGIAWTPWLKNVKSFKDAPAFTAQISFTFNMGQFGLWDAKEEVFKPVMNLMAFFIPIGINGINIIPHLRTSTQTLYDFLRASKGDFSSLLTDLKSSVTTTPKDIDETSSRLSSTLGHIFASLSTGLGKVVVTSIETKPGVPYNIDIGYASGKFMLKRMQPTTCDISFTNKEYDANGFPVQGKITMNFQSYQPATVEGIIENKINFGFIKG